MATVVFRMLLDGLNQVLGLRHHPRFVVFVEDTVPMAKHHSSLCKHQRKKYAFKNDTIKTGNGSFNHAAEPLDKIKHASSPHTVDVYNLKKKMITAYTISAKYSNKIIGLRASPALAISCLNRESSALANERLDVSFLTEEQKEWVSKSCPTSLGPSLYISCVQRESAALRRTQYVPQQPRVDTSRVQRQRYAVPRHGSSHDSYEIEVAHNDELFIINGEKFEAQTYCIGWEEGGEVLFIEGSPYGACASATLLNLRTREKCDVWCE